LENDIEKKHKTIIAEIDKKIKRQETKEKKNKKIEKKEEKNIICPHCNTIITVEYDSSQKIEIKCPICGNKGITKSESNKATFEKPVTKKTNIKKTKQADKLETHPPKNLSSFIRSNFITLILITIGIILLYNPTTQNIKISFTLILIGLILMFILTEESPSKILKIRLNKTSDLKSNYKHVFRKNNKHIDAFNKKNLNQLNRIEHESFKKINLSISHTITFAYIIWIILLFFITNDKELEVFFVLILIGMLIVRELTDELTSIRLKHRMDGFIYVFLTVFIWIIGEKIINILNM